MHQIVVGSIPVRKNVVTTFKLLDKIDGVLENGTYRRCLLKVTDPF